MKLNSQNGETRSNFRVYILQVSAPINTYTSLIKSIAQTSDKKSYSLVVPRNHLDYPSEFRGIVLLKCVVTVQPPEAR